VQKSETHVAIVFIFLLFGRQSVNLFARIFVSERIRSNKTGVNELQNVTTGPSPPRVTRQRRSEKYQTVVIKRGPPIDPKSVKLASGVLKHVSTLSRRLYREKNKNRNNLYCRNYWCRCCKKKKKYV